MTSLRRVQKIVEAVEQTDGVGARVRRSIGRRELRSLDPFLMLDHFFVGKPAGFPDHPHRGFETVTYMLKGSFEHEDFMGNRGIIGPGDLQWMTAGRGIVHAEVPLGDEVAEGLQLWVNLPRSHKMMEPRYQEFPKSRVPEKTVDGVTAKVISGEALGIRSAVQTITETHYIHFVLDPDTSLIHPVPVGFTAFIYAVSGEGRVGETTVKAGSCAVLSSEGDQVKVTTAENQTFSFVFLAGMPIKEPVVQHGPFVLCTMEELQQTFEDYDESKNGFERRKRWTSTIANRVE